MLLKINKEFVRAQYEIFTLGWKKCQLYRKFVKLLTLTCYQRKTNFEVHRNLSANNTLVAVFEICFKTQFYNVEKRRKCSEITATP